MKIIRTKEDHEEALRLASELFANPPPIGTPAGDYFEVLLKLIETYEKKVYPIEAPAPIETIKFRLEQREVLDESPFNNVVIPPKKSDLP